MAVAVPPYVFTAGNLAERIDSAAQEAGIDPELVMVELSERAALARPELTARRLRELRRHGVRTTLRAVGAARSSLLRLAEVPCDYFKLDARLVQRLPHARSAEAVIGGLTALAGRLEIETIADGIETAEQVGVLRAHGCRLGQGPHLALPQRAGDLEPHLPRTAPALA